MGLMVVAMCLGVNLNVSANEYLPDTDLITAQNELVIVGSGDGATPVWISKNPTCYNKQVLKTGVWESWIDTDENIVYVVKDGNVVKTVKL